MANPTTAIDGHSAAATASIRGDRRSLAMVALAWILVTTLAANVKAQPDWSAMRKINARMPPPPRIVDEAVRAQGLSVHRGRHLTLFTDVRAEAMVADLVASFDAAVPLWCDIFEIPLEQASAWHLIGCLATSAERFQGTGLWDDVPDFPAGFNRGYQIWMYLQEGNYYTRHLMLHEGTHAFMQWFLGGSGPPWYSEGMAEWLGLHSMTDGRLSLRFRPKRREQVEQWGRPKLIRKALDNGRRLRLDQVFDLPNSAFRDVEYYAWAWAACDFLSSHPLTHKTFRELVARAADTSTGFNAVWQRELGQQWNTIERDWYLFIDELDYGIEAQRVAVTDAETSLADERIMVKLATDRSWQRTGWFIEKGETIAVESRGRYQIADGTQPWLAESGGITIQYYRGRPLGQLMAAVLAEPEPGAAPIHSVIPLGTDAQVTFAASGELVLRINESPARMDDNQGFLDVLLRRHRER